MLRTIRQSREFQGKPLETHVLHTWGQLPFPRVILVGLGAGKELSRAGLARAAAAAARAAGKLGCRTLGVWLPVPAAVQLPLDAQAEAIAEGVLIGAYRFEQYKSSSDNQTPKRLREVVLAVRRQDHARAQPAARRGQSLAEAVNYARDIANQPGNVIDPQRLAAEAVALGRECGLRVRVWDRAKLQRENFGGILAVGGGSQREPRFIQIEYKPRAAAARPPQRPVVLVGKAITFDSGGISIKPSEKMDEMKFDKCGGVAVLGAMRAIAALKLPVPVVGLIAAAENMPSATSYRPGDIVRTYSGATVEVLNTDAEGRIVLGDALAYAKRFQPQAVVDLATLTGACVVALGPFAAGLFSNHDRLSERLRAAGESTGERVWPFPMWDDYHDMIKSPVADIKNTGGRYGGAITAAAFLQKFIGKVPWAHLDIAGTAWTTEEKPHLARGGTAFGVRLLAELLSDWKPL
jgi:leucyl aminopeptidase